MLPDLQAHVKLHHDDTGRPTLVLAFVELEIGGAFVIKGVRVLAKRGEAMPFVAFPAEKGRGANADRWFDIAHPVTAEARVAAVGVILKAYRAAVQEEPS